MAGGDVFALWVLGLSLAALMGFALVAAHLEVDRRAFVLASRELDLQQREAARRARQEENRG